ncbi:MAG: hypothetical protein AAGA90_08005 [Actinomycetota bacterium]
MHWVPFVSMVGAATACAAHGWAVLETNRSRQPHAPTWMAMSVAAGLLAAVYTIGYAWLLFGDVERGEWSQTLQYVGLITWPLVWVLPGVTTAWVARRATQRRAGEQGLS